MQEGELQELRCPRAAHQPCAGEGLWEDEGRGCDGAPWGSWEHLGGVHTVGAFVFLLLELGGTGLGTSHEVVGSARCYPAAPWVPIFTLSDVSFIFSLQVWRSIR